MLAAASVAYLLGPSFLNIGPIYNLIGASSVVAILVATRLYRPRPALPWYLFALGQALFVSGDVITYNYERFFGTELPFPSIGDILYIAMYPSLVVGLLILIHHRYPGRDWASLIDSLIIAIGAGVLSWVFLMSPYAHDASLTLQVKLTSMAYPIMDLLLLAVTIRLAVGGGKREKSFYLLVTSVCVLFVTDSVYAWLLLHGGYQTGGLLDAGWIAFYLLWGAAALHPSMVSLSEPAPDQESGLTWTRLALLTGGTLIAPTVLAVQEIRDQQVDDLVIAISAVALFMLVVARMAGLVHRNEQAAERERTLREAGAELVTATDREGMYAAALTAAQKLAGDECEVRLSLVVDSPGELATVATTAAADAGPDVAAHTLDDLPQWARFRLLDKHSTEVGAEPRVFLSPLFMRAELRGLLAVSSPRPLPRRVKEGLETLAFEVALALESAALTEDLVRRQSEARFSSLVQNSSDVVTVIAPDTSIKYLSPSVERVLGYHPGDLEGTRFADLVHEEDVTRVLSFFSSAVNEPKAHPGLIEFRMLHRDGGWPYVETLRTNLLHDPNVAGMVLNTRDVSERKAFEQQLSYQAFHDPVTGLANRALFKDRVEHALERQQRKEQPVAVLFIDLDDFKTVNDSLGHAAGDELLRQVGQRLAACLRAADTAARLGGDEFALLLEDVEYGARAADVADRVLEELEAPFHLEGKEMFVRASVGIAFGDLDNQGRKGAEELLRNADVAMYGAKEQGKGRYQIFQPAMHATVVQRLELKADLQRALENDEFRLHYQPIIVLETGRVSGLEALIRWQHAERGMIGPNEFIPLAEDTGLIIPIGRWVLERACKAAVELQRAYPSDPPLTMSVNISARQLQRPEIVTEVRHALELTGLDPASLVLEITESVMMQDIDFSILRLQELKDVGVRLAVDDFGTGYSSLNYIRRFPVDILKVDKSFIDSISDRNEESALTAAIIDLAGILRLSPVAEGVERIEQLERLLELHCDLGQGFHFARPMTQEHITDLLSAETGDRRGDGALSS